MRGGSGTSAFAAGETLGACWEYAEAILHKKAGRRATQRLTRMEGTASRRRCGVDRAISRPASGPLSTGPKQRKTYSFPPFKRKAY